MDLRKKTIGQPEIVHKTRDLPFASPGTFFAGLEAGNQLFSQK